MTKSMLILAIFFCTIQFTFSQNSKSSFHFKSIRIENGDTIVEEKNVESDDPNFSFSDSLMSGGFSFHSGKNLSPDFMFPDFGINPFQPFQSPFNNDSILQQYFNQPMIDSNLLHLYFPEFNEDDLLDSQSYLAEINQQNEIKTNIIQGTGLMNITFNLSPDFETELRLISKEGLIVFEERFEKSSAFFIKQIDISKFASGDYTIILNQGNIKKTTSVFIER